MLNPPEKALAHATSLSTVIEVGMFYNPLREIVSDTTTLPRLTLLRSRLIRGRSGIVAAPDTFILINTHIQVRIHVVFSVLLFDQYFVAGMFL